MPDEHCVHVPLLLGPRDRAQVIVTWMVVPRCPPCHLATALCAPLFPLSYHRIVSLLATLLAPILFCACACACSMYICCVLVRSQPTSVLDAKSRVAASVPPCLAFGLLPVELIEHRTRGTLRDLEEISLQLV